MEAIAHRGVLDRPAALRLFAAQFGVATVRQLVQAGVPERTIDRAKQRGVVAGILPGVVELADFPPTFRQRAMAAQLFGGDGSFLAGTTAARLYGIRGMPQRPIELVTITRRRGSLPDWLQRSFSTWIDHEDVVVRDDGLRIAAPPLMLLGLAARLDDVRFERTAEDAWHLRLVTPAQAAEYLQQIAAPGRRGVNRMRRWLERVATASPPRAEWPGDRCRQRRHRRRSPCTRPSASRDAPQWCGHPPRPRLARCQARLRTGPLMVAWRGSRPTCRPAAPPRVCGGRLAGRELRRVGGEQPRPVGAEMATIYHQRRQAVPRRLTATAPNSLASVTTLAGANHANET